MERTRRAENHGRLARFRNSSASRIFFPRCLLLLRQRLDLILTFILGVSIGAFVYHSVAITASTSTRTQSALSYDHVSASISTKDSFLHQHAMIWKSPDHIANEREEECNKEGKFSKKTHSKTGGFCLDKDDPHVGGNQLYDKPMADFLGSNVFNGKKVVDLGAGLGHYGKIFKESKDYKVDWVGYDGAINVQEATNGLVKYMDLAQPHATDERPCVAGDWVLSLEVAEHLPLEYMDAFLRNIRCHAREGAVISWARPGQGGHGHFNEMDEQEVVKAVEKWGFKVDWNLTHHTRDIATLPWFKNTPIVYHVVA